MGIGFATAAVFAFLAEASPPPSSEPPCPDPAAVEAQLARLGVEARSLADALERWRRDGNGEAALTLLAGHERRYPRGALWVETRVARAEILLSLSRNPEALAALDSLSLANLPRARELSTLRGELRAQAGRCAEARVDLARVLSSTETDELGKRARRALSSCP